MIGEFVARPCQRMYLRDGRVIDLSGMADLDAHAFVADVEQLTDQGVRIVYGVELLVDGGVLRLDRGFLTRVVRCDTEGES